MRYDVICNNNNNTEQLSNKPIAVFIPKESIDSAAAPYFERGENIKYVDMVL